MNDVNIERKAYILISDIYSSKNYVLKEIVDNGFKIIAFFTMVNKYLRVKNSLNFEYVDYSMISNGSIMDNIRSVKKHLNANNGELKLCITESAPELAEQHFFSSISEKANKPKRLSSIFTKRRKIENNSCTNLVNTNKNLDNFDNKTLNSNYLFNDPVIQKSEYGIQYFIDTVTYHSKHYICGICKVVDYDFNEGKKLPQYWDFIHPDDTKIKNCISYVKELLDISDIEYGFAHSKVIMDKDGAFDLFEFRPGIVGGEGIVSKLNKEFIGYDQPNLLCKLINCTEDIKYKKQVYYYRVFFLYSSSFSYKRVDEVKLETLDSYHMHRIYKNNSINKSNDFDTEGETTEVVLKNMVFEDIENDSNKLLEMKESGILFMNTIKY